MWKVINRRIFPDSGQLEHVSRNEARPISERALEPLIAISLVSTPEYHHCHCLFVYRTTPIKKMKFSLSVIVASLGAASAFAFNSGSSQATIAQQSSSFRRSALAQPAFKNHFQTDDSSTALAATAATANSDAIKTRGGGALGGIDIRKFRISCKNVLYHVMCTSHCFVFYS